MSWIDLGIALMFFISLAMAILLIIFSKRIVIWFWQKSVNFQKQILRKANIKTESLIRNAHLPEQQIFTLWLIRVFGFFWAAISVYGLFIFFSNM